MQTLEHFWPCNSVPRTYQIPQPELELKLELEQFPPTVPPNSVPRQQSMTMELELELELVLHPPPTCSYINHGTRTRTRTVPPQQFPPTQFHDTRALLACRDEKMQTLEHFWPVKMRKFKH